MSRLHSYSSIYNVGHRWAGVQYQPQGRSGSSAGYFYEAKNGLDRPAKARIDYFAPLFVGTIDIRSVTSPTTHDGDKAWLFGCAKGVERASETNAGQGNAHRV